MTFEAIPVADAVRRLSLDEHFEGLESLYEPPSLDGMGEMLQRLGLDRIPALPPPPVTFVRHYKSGTTIAGDLALQSLFLDEDVAGLVIDGDLTVEGNIIDTEIDEFAAFLLVKGNCSARNVALGGAQVVVLGGLRSLGIVWTDYNHGRLLVEGDLAASHLVIGGHDTVILGAVPRESWARANDYVAPEMDSKVRRFRNYADILTNDAARDLLEDDGWPRTGASQDLALVQISGRRILRDSTP